MKTSSMLLNRINKEILKRKLKNEPFQRRTLSFYRYVSISNPADFRDRLYKKWYELACFGRIYIASEGINAQMSVPMHNLERFLTSLKDHPELADIPIKYAIEDNGKSFYKLTIKVRPRIVADDLDESSYNMSRVGKHLSPVEFHKAIDDPDTIVIDMRNHYESEIGRFENAYCPPADTFRDAIRMVADKFENNRRQKILLYCTGGIRCEKASSYLIHNGFENVYQLEGGIIAYATQLKEQNIPSKFIGKNFVFDERLGESVNGKIISSCHQCGEPCDSYINCANNDCHMLFIQCEKCREKYHGCCSEDCKHIASLPLSEQKKYRSLRYDKYSNSRIFSNNMRFFSK